MRLDSFQLYWEREYNLTGEGQEKAYGRFAAVLEVDNDHTEAHRAMWRMLAPNPPWYQPLMAKDPLTLPAHRCPLPDPIPPLYPAAYGRRAVCHLAEILRVTPGDPHANTQVGVFCSDIGRFERMCCARCGRWLLPSRMCARLSERRVPDRNHDALHHFATAVQGDGTNPELQYNYATALWKVGKLGKVDVTALCCIFAATMSPSACK